MTNREYLKSLDNSELAVFLSLLANGPNDYSQYIEHNFKWLNSTTKFIANEFKGTARHYLDNTLTEDVN